MSLKMYLAIQGGLEQVGLSCKGLNRLIESNSGGKVSNSQRNRRYMKPIMTKQG